VLTVKEPSFAMFDGPSPAPSLRTDVELAGADCSVPTAYGPPRRLPRTRNSDHPGVT
jgi:hypothetical protein